MSNKRLRVQSHPEGESLTVQSHADDADINKMVARHMKGPGRFGNPIGNPNASRQPRFGDFSNVDYHTMLNRVAEIDQSFARLPARLRNRFRNRPELLLSFVADPNNVKEAVKLGLIDDREVIQEVLDAEQMDLEQQAKEAGEASNVPPKPAQGGLPEGDK